MPANNIKPEDLHAENTESFTNTTKAGSFSPKPAQKINKKATSTKPQDPSVDNFKATSEQQAPSTNELDRDPGLGYYRITEDSKKSAPKRSPSGPLSPSPARLSAMTQFEKSGRSCESSSGHKGLKQIRDKRHKHQAPKVSSRKRQASSPKPQASSRKPEATSA